MQGAANSGIIVLFCLSVYFIIILYSLVFILLCIYFVFTCMSSYSKVSARYIHFWKHHMIPRDLLSPALSRIRRIPSIHTPE